MDKKQVYTAIRDAFSAKKFRNRVINPYAKSIRAMFSDENALKSLNKATKELAELEEKGTGILEPTVAWGSTIGTGVGANYIRKKMNKND